MGKFAVIKSLISQDTSTLRGFVAGNSRYFGAVATQWRRNLVAIMWQFGGKFRHDGMENLRGGCFVF
ncbi:MAG: hypothetical protein ACTTIV_07170 [Campylobacter sp.]